MFLGDRGSCYAEGCGCSCSFARVLPLFCCCSPSPSCQLLARREPRLLLSFGICCFFKLDTRPADTKIVTSPTRLWKSSLANSRPWDSSVPYLSFSLQTLETHRVSWGDCPSPTQVSILMQFFASFPTLAPCKPLPKCLASRHRVEKGIQQETAVSRQCLS